MVTRVISRRAARRPDAVRRTRLSPVAAAAILGLSGLMALGAGAQEATPVVRFNVERFDVVGANPLSAAETEAVLSRYVGEQAGVDGLLAAADELEAAIRRTGVSFHRVVLPPQKLTDGSVELKVVKFKVSGVNVRGNEFYGEDNIRRSVPSLREGVTPDTREMARSLAVANKVPSKNLTLTFRESDTDPEGLEADLEVKDDKPWSLFASVANTGSAASGPLRATFGGSVTNIFDRDHTAAMSYTTSPGHPSQVKQWAGTYSLPIYRYGGSLSGYYVHSDVATGRLLDTFDVAGAGRFGGIRYTHEFARRGKLTHRFSVGVDDKRFDNNVIAAGVNLATDVRSRPITGSWAAEYAGEGFGATMHLDYVRNTTSGGGNNTIAYGRNRAGADANWDLFRAGGSVTFPIFEEWTGRAKFEGQYANEQLIAGEQFGLGGVHSVRGFAEREVSGDNGIAINAELWSPRMNSSGLRFVLFGDMGRVDNKEAVGEAQSSGQDLASVGVGARWNWREHTSFLFDVGQVLVGPPTRESGARGHVNVLVKY